MRWSRLRKLIEGIVAPELDFEIRCTRYRRPRGPDFGRYCVILNGETIWAEPASLDFEKSAQTPNPVASEITALIREYLDTPRSELMTKQFPADRWNFTDILRAADRRIGKERLRQLLNYRQDAAGKVAAARLKSTRA
jgi:hypothetical protein